MKNEKKLKRRKEYNNEMKKDYVIDIEQAVSNYLVRNDYLIESLNFDTFLKLNKLSAEDVFKLILRKYGDTYLSKEFYNNSNVKKQIDEFARNWLEVSIKFHQKNLNNKEQLKNSKGLSLLYEEDHKFKYRQRISNLVTKTFDKIETFLEKNPIKLTKMDLIHEFIIKNAKEHKMKPDGWFDVYFNNLKKIELEYEIVNTRENFASRLCAEQERFKRGYMKGLKILKKMNSRLVKSNLGKTDTNLKEPNISFFDKRLEHLNNIFKKNDEIASIYRQKLNKLDADRRTILKEAFGCIYTNVNIIDEKLEENFKADLNVKGKTLNKIKKQSTMQGNRVDIEERKTGKEEIKEHIVNQTKNLIEEFGGKQIKVVQEKNKNFVGKLRKEQKKIKEEKRKVYAEKKAKEIKEQKELRKEQLMQQSGLNLKDKYIKANDTDEKEKIVDENFINKQVEEEFAEPSFIARVGKACPGAIGYTLLAIDIAKKLKLDDFLRKKTMKYVDKFAENFGEKFSKKKKDKGKYLDMFLHFEDDFFKDLEKLEDAFSGRAKYIQAWFVNQMIMLHKQAYIFRELKDEEMVKECNIQYEKFLEYWAYITSRDFKINRKKLINQFLSVIQKKEVNDKKKELIQMDVDIILASLNSFFELNAKNKVKWSNYQEEVKNMKKRSKYIDSLKDEIAETTLNLKFFTKILKGYEISDEEIPSNFKTINKTFTTKLYNNETEIARIINTRDEDYAAAALNIFLEHEVLPLTEKTQRHNLTDGHNDKNDTLLHIILKQGKGIFFERIVKLIEKDKSLKLPDIFNLSAVNKDGFNIVQTAVLAGNESNLNKLIDLLEKSDIEETILVELFKFAVPKIEKGMWGKAKNIHKKNTLSRKFWIAAKEQCISLLKNPSLYYEGEKIQVIYKKLEKNFITDLQKMNEQLLGVKKDLGQVIDTHSDKALIEKFQVDLDKLIQINTLLLKQGTLNDVDLNILIKFYYDYKQFLEGVAAVLYQDLDYEIPYYIGRFVVYKKNYPNHFAVINNISAEKLDEMMKKIKKDNKKDEIKKILRKRDKNDNSLMSLACEFGRVKIVRKLLKEGVKVDKSGPNNVSGFLLAAKNKQQNVVDELLNIRERKWFFKSGGFQRRYVEVSTKRQVVHYLAEQCQTESILKLLFEKRTTMYSVGRAILDAYEGDYVSIRNMIDLDPKNNKKPMKDIYGDTPLHLLIKSCLKENPKHKENIEKVKKFFYKLQDKLYKHSNVENAVGEIFAQSLSAKDSQGKNPIEYANQIDDEELKNIMKKARTLGLGKRYKIKKNKI